MSARLDRTNITDSEWERHKDTIKQLYLTDRKKLEGHHGVIETMANLHNFVATKSQYERRFKQWGFRKNRKSAEWVSVAKILRERDRAGKESVVYQNGESICVSKIRKETSRHGFISTLEQFNGGPRPRTPQGFTIRTPVIEDRTPFWTCNLPFVEFEVLLHTAGRFDTNSVYESAVLVSMEVFKVVSLFALSDVATENHLEFPRTFENHEFGNLAYRNCSYAASIPEFSVGEMMLLESSGSGVFQQLAATHFGMVIPTLKSLLPSTVLEGYHGPQSSVLSCNETFSSAYLRLLIFAVTNNFAGLGSLPYKNILQYLQSKTSMQFSQLLRSIPGPTSKALAEKLFLCAIEAGDARIVEVLLQDQYAEIDANEHVCIINEERYTPVERSSELGDISVTKVLIRYGADVNKTFDKNKNRYGGHGALQRAILQQRDHKHVDLVLVRTLLDAGAQVTTGLLEHGFCYKNNEVAETFAHAVADDTSNHDEWSKCEILFNAIRFLDSKVALRIIEIMLQVNVDINGHAAQMFRGGARRLIDLAAEQPHLEVVQLLLDSGAHLTDSTLICAIRGANMELVRVILDAGASVDSLATLNGEVTTPFAEAIRSRNIGLIQSLEQNGASRQLKERFRFRAALEAASEVGDIELVESLLQIGVNDRSALGCALAAATRADQDRIAFMLIDAGANVNGNIHNDDGSPALLEALRRRNADLVRAILNSDVNVRNGALQEATEWGDYSIVKDLIRAGFNVNAVRRFSKGCQGQQTAETPLTTATRKKDTRLVQLLLEAGADINNPLARTSGVVIATALEAAVTNGDIDMVRFLLSKGADPDDSKALLEALSQSTEMVDLLLQEFVKRYPDGKKEYGSTALKKAIQDGNGNIHLLKTLLSNRIGINGFCVQYNYPFLETPLAWAIKKNQGTTLLEAQMLLDSGADPNSVISYEEYHGYPSSTRPPRLTALLVAISTKEIPMVQLLLKHGADMNFPAIMGVKRTPLQQAAEIGTLDVVQTLLNHGAHVNAPPADRGGGTALQLAAIGGYLGIACLLLKQGAAVNAQPSKVDGRTALEGAAEHGRLDMVKLLMNAGAEIQGTWRRHYENAIQLAKENGHFAILDLLESYSSQG